MTRNRLTITALAILALSVTPGRSHADLSATPSISIPVPQEVWQVSAGGDMNGDGYSDLVVARYGNTGVDVYLGSALGVSSTPDWSVLPGPASQSFGLSAATVGDLNRDGLDDLAVSDIGSPLSYGPGSVYVWFGRSNLATAPDGGFSPPLLPPDWTVSFTAGVAAVTIAPCGDLDADGDDELCLGNSHIVGPLPAAPGSVFVWLGGPSFEASSGGTDAGANWSATGATPMFGFAAAGVGDVNGDGIADLAVGDGSYSAGVIPVQGGVFVYHGSPTFASEPLGTVANADLVMLGDVASARLGDSLAPAGDVNGDGYADIFAQGASRFRIFSGVPTGTTTYAMWSVDSSDPAPPVGFPHPVCTAGDVNGDGLADVLLGLRTSNRVDVYFGRLFGPPPTAAASETRPAVSTLRNWAATTGDLNGDGYSDLVMRNATPPPTVSVTVDVYYGSGYPTEVDIGHTSFGSHFGASFGISAAPAGDINGDGYSDYVAGEPAFANGETNEGRFRPVYGGSCGPSCAPIAPTPSSSWEGNQEDAQQGWSVSGVNDLNGDGFDDVVVGAPLFDHFSGPVSDLDAGRIQVYLGAETGLSAAPSFTLEGADGPGAQLGFEVSNAGDVNGDGLGDFLVAAPYASPGGVSQAGKVYLYLGAATPSGVVPAPAWTRSGTLVNEHLGIEIAGAGDVNRDGRSDILVGAALGVTGRVTGYLFLGQPGGAGSSPAATMYGFQAGSDYGLTLASAGDVDGNGYSDVAMGEPEVDLNRGIVRVFRAYASGLDVLTPTSMIGPTSDWRFGSGIGGGGDVNGDGYGDVVIGSQWASGPPNFIFAAGQAEVFLGGALGLSTTPARTLVDVIDETTDFGRDVALNLDANGDGFSDVIVGAFGYLGDGGAVFMHFGGGGRGTPRRLYMRRLSGAFEPIAGLGTIKPELEGNAFQAMTNLRSAAGREQVRAEVETKPLGTPFDGTGLSGGVTQLLTGLDGATLSTVSNCAFPDVCKWRLRQRSPNPLFPGTPWFSAPGNSPTETDLRGGPDGDADLVYDAADKCPTVSDPSQTDTDADGVGNACDNCVFVSNPRVDMSLLTAGASSNANLVWATTTGGQRDDDHDGYGNKCDGDFTPTGLNVGTLDVAQYNASSGKSRITDTCGTAGNQPCARFDLDEGTGLNIGTPDKARLNALIGFPAGGVTPAGSGKCPTCPLTCAAGSAGSCN